MVRPKKHDALDEAIAKTTPGQPPRPDFHAWRTTHADALATLKRQAQQHSHPRRPVWIRIGKLAVAAGIIVAAVLLAMYLTNRQMAPSTPDPVAIERSEPGLADTERMEFAQADELYEAGDIGGLLTLLRTGREETRIRAAEYLGQIGTPAALPALEQLASQWQAAPGQPAIQEAIDRIRQREREQSGSNDSGTEPLRTLVIAGQGESQDDSTQGQPQTEEQGTVTVETVDRDTGLRLADVLVQAVPPGEEVSLLLGRTDEHGRCTLTVPAGSWQIVAQGWKDGHYEPFAEAVAVRPERSQRVRLSMTARRKIVGRLIDDEGRGVQGTVQLDGQAPTDTGPEGWFAVDEPFGDGSAYHVLWAYDRPRRAGRMIQFRMATHMEPLTISLAPCATIVGRIIDSQGLPLSPAEIQLAVDRPDGTTFCYGPVPWITQMVGDGAFAIVGVPRGLPVRVIAWIRGSHFESGEAKVERLGSGQTVDVGDISVGDFYPFAIGEGLTGALCGVVTDESGRRLDTIQVRSSAGGSQNFRTEWYSLVEQPRGVRICLSIFFTDYSGAVYRYAYADNGDVNVRVALYGWHLLGKKAPPLSVAKWGLNGPVVLNQLQGRVVFLMIGMLWRAKPNEINWLQSMSEAYGARGLEVVAVHHSPDSDGEGEARVRDTRVSLLATNAASGVAVGLDDDGRTWSAYGATVSPTVYLIDKQGYVRVSTTSGQLRKEWIEALLAE